MKEIINEGEWIGAYTDFSWYGKCSNCLESFHMPVRLLTKMNFCPNCGIPMNNNKMKYIQSKTDIIEGVQNERNN